jgi:hypothetical protein
MDHYTDAITKIEQHILEVAGKSPAYLRLQEMSGIGKILGLTIALETGDAKRFAGPGNFASYCRCVKSLQQSNHKKKGENNRKCGNKYLAWAFVEVAHFACRHDDQCRRYYDRKKQQTNPVIATKALACKLAKAAWDGRQLARPIQPRQLVGIAPVGLHAVRGFPGNERGRNDIAMKALGSQMAAQDEPAGTGFIDQMQLDVLKSEFFEELAHGSQRAADDAVTADLGGVSGRDGNGNAWTRSLPLTRPSACAIAHSFRRFPSASNPCGCPGRCNV